MAEQLVGVVLGATSLLAGYAFHQFSQMRSKELSYLQHVPQFTNMQKLREHLLNCQDNKADVLIEGVVKKLGSEALKSEKGGVEGAAKLVTTTMYKKVYDSTNSKWNDVSSSIENLCVSVPFQLSDRNGVTVTVQPIHNAGGFRQILERVWQERVGPDSRSLGDYATNTELKEISNGSHTREFLLTFGTTLGAYGTATLQSKTFLSSGSINFIPSEVSSSIQGLMETRELIVSVFSFMSLLFVVGGGGLLLFSTVPLVMRALGYQVERESERQTAEN